MEKIKVLMVGSDPSVKGGIGSVIGQMLQHDWNAENVQMDFIPTYKETNNIKMILYFMKQFPKVKKYIREEKPDVVHIHMSYKGSFLRKYEIHKFCVANGVPDIIHLHGSEFKQWYEAMGSNTQEKIRKLLKESKAFIVLGNKWNEAVKEIEPDTNTVVVSNTVHVPEETVSWNAERFQVLFLGVLLKRKGVEDLLKAAKLLKDTGRIGKMKFVIAGTGEKETELKDFSKKNDLNDVVDFAGWTAGEAKTKLLKESQILVLPSYNEGLPVAILEAISYGMPVVATDVGDISSAVHDGENGYLVDPGDVNRLSDSIYKISSSKETHEEMVTMSKMIARNDFADEKYFVQISNCYKKVIRGIRG